MSNMTDNDTERYNGYANRETWAFNLHWQNDQGLYADTLDMARQYLIDTYDTERQALDAGELKAAEWGVGEYIANYWREVIDNFEEAGGRLPPSLKMFRDEVGSWWRIDYREVGEAVRESLAAEGMGEVVESD